MVRVPDQGDSHCGVWPRGFSWNDSHTPPARDRNILRATRRSLQFPLPQGCQTPSTVPRVQSSPDNASPPGSAILSPPAVQRTRDAGLSLPGPSREGKEGKGVASSHILQGKAQGVEDLRGQDLLKCLPGPGGG